jgi:ketosteroid isomerase-like protein
MLLLAAPVAAQTAPDAAELTRLLKEFLAGASRNDPAVHERFWAEDLIYTRSAGARVGKADILGGLRSAPTPPPGAPVTTYSAEDIRIQQYGDTAIVAFQLVGTTPRDGKAEVARFLNTATFLKRGGKWQVVAWQATRVPRSDGEAEVEVLAAHDALQDALRDADVKALEALLAEGFTWSDGAGREHTRQAVIEQAGAGLLKYPKPEAKGVSVAVHGGAAVVRGTWPGQPAAPSGGERSGGPKPSATSYTLTFGNQGSGWKVVTMHGRSCCL